MRLNYETEKKLRCMNKPNGAPTAQDCMRYCTLSCMSCMYFGFSVPPPGSACWWGLQRRTPPSLVLWRLGPFTTAPGLEALTAADRYLLTILVSNLKAFFNFLFHVMDQNEFITSLLGAPLGINLFYSVLPLWDMARNNFTVIFKQIVRHMFNSVIVL